MPKWYGCHMESIIDDTNGAEWIFHWNKLLTYYKEIASWRNQKSLSNFQYYFFIDFFTSCYHFRDWLLESNKIFERVPDINKKIEELQKNNIEIKFCRDICNAYKHKNYKYFSLDSHPSYIKEFNPYYNRTEYFFAFSDEKNKKFYKNEVFELSEKVINIWQNFLLNAGISEIKQIQT